MPNENDSNSPADSANEHSGTQSEILPKAIEHSAIGAQRNNDTKDEQSTAKEMRREFRWFEWTSVFINGALAVIGVIALCIYHGQLTVMSGQLTEMQEARKQAKVDNAGAITAQQRIAQDSLTKSQENVDKSSRSAEKTFRDDQRAWVGVQGTSPSEGFTETLPWKITIIFFNSGKTPARNVKFSSIYKTSPVPLPGPLPEDLKQLVFQPVPSIAPQGNRREVIGGTAMGQALSSAQIEGQQTISSEYTAIKNRQLILYYFGVLRYDDISGQTRETQYCIYLANPDTKEAGICSAFNDMN